VDGWEVPRAVEVDAYDLAAAGIASGRRRGSQHGHVGKSQTETYMVVWIATLAEVAARECCQDGS